jgi:alpha-1,6-mannosyltransferase
MLATFGNRREQRSAAVFAGAVVVISAVWFFGFAMRANLWSVDEAIVLNPGMWKVFTDGISSLFEVTLLIGVASAAYLVALAMLHRGFKHGFVAAIVASVLAGLAIFPQMPMASPDAGHLSADVRTLWLYGVNPASSEGAPEDTSRAVLLRELTEEPVASKIRVLAFGQSGYGPLSYAIGGIALPFVGDDIRDNMAGQKAVAGLFLISTAVIAGLLARNLGGNPGFATAFVGLNPLLIFQFPGDGHNDSIMAAFGALAVLLAISATARVRAGGVGAVAASIAAKYSFVFVGPIVLVYWLPRYRHVVGVLTVLGGAAFVYVIVGEPPLPAGAVVPAVAVGLNSPWQIVLRWADISRDTTSALAFSSFFLVLASIVWLRPIRNAREMVMLCGVTLWLLMFLGLAAYSPWYQIWYLPLVAAAGSRWLTGVALTFSIGTFATILARNWLRDLVVEVSIDDPIEWSVALLWASTAAVGLLLWYRDSERRRQPARIDRRRRGAPARRRRRA